VITGTSGDNIQWTCLIQMPVCPVARPHNNSVFLLDCLDIAGLETKEVSERLLFFRHEAAGLWDALDQFKLQYASKSGFDVQGSSGVGKSTAVWAWLCYQNSISTDAGDRAFAVWIHLSPDMASKVSVLRQESIYCSDMSSDHVVMFLKSIDTRFVILDGYCSDRVMFHQKLSEAAYSKRIESISQFIRVHSMAVKLRLEENRIYGICWFEIFPWSLEQYLAAISKKTFLTSVLSKLSLQSNLSEAEVIDVVKKKYHFAGGSARWMFSLSQEELLANIYLHLARVPNVKHLLNGVVGDNSAASSNHLMVRYKSGNGYHDASFIISKFVVSLLLFSCRRSVFKVMYDMFIHQVNPSFLGWVTEFDFIWQLKQCAVDMKNFIFVSGNNNEAIVWSVPALIEFDPDSAFSKLDMPVGTWLKPVKWSQEGYALVCHCFNPQSKKHYLCFVQVTDAVDHTANLVHFQCLAFKARKILGFSLGVEIIVVSPAYCAKNPTKIKITNAHMLKQWKIGSTDTDWTAQNMDSSIKYLYFARQCDVPKH
jgi:hypothetical protein